MEDEKSDGGGAEVEDEFACSGMLRGSLASLHDTVERIFRVAFAIGADDSSHGGNGQIWLKLRGASSDVRAAKLFVRGIVNQEEQKEVSYPGVLHCVFCGAKGLFMDCLIKSTSAHIVVGSPGLLLISGIAEPVVRAYSLVMDLVERYEGTQSRRPEAGERGPAESLESRRAFKALVEKWDDRHILDLLVLPGSVKEILLDLVMESGLGSSPGQAPVGGFDGARPHGDIWDKPSAVTLPEDSSTADKWLNGLSAGSGEDHAARDLFYQALAPSAGARGQAVGAEERQICSPQEVGDEEQPAGAAGIKEEDQHLSVGNKEFLLLLRFFTAMGYTEDVVKRVLACTGLKEASQILDLVQQEQDRSDKERKEKNQDAPKQGEKNRPCETEHKENEDSAGDEVMSRDVEMLEEHEMVEGAAGGLKHFEGDVIVEEKDEASEEDFVLVVLKKAAASCGYAEQNVTKVYSMLPDRSTHQLLLELQKEGVRDSDPAKEEPREMDDVVLEKEGRKAGPAEDAGRREVLPVRPFKPAERKDTKERDGPAEPDLSPWIQNLQQPSKAQISHQTVLPEIKGPPTPTYPSSLDPPLTNFQSNKQFAHNLNPPVSKVNRQGPKNQSPSNSLKQALQAIQPPVLAGVDSSRASMRHGLMPASSVVVTGEQRFLEGLQTPFELKLTDKPGDPKLRTIIIDGSNVAMSHGLSHFFSCRGIALAVQHFWDRGHRHISALLPQWRQKSDSRNKEQHYLTELQKLGLLSYTPSREVQGKRISSYDDRLMLQLAQKTDGVIVTNDNLRDLSDESVVWRDIIKKRLLQYTFVGDHFMVPDDPLGRGGPHLDDFLRSDHRIKPDPGNHSFAGVATNFPPFKPPRSQTEVLNFRDRTLGGALDAAGGGSRGRGRGHHGKGWDAGHHPLRQGKAGPEAPDRTPQETAGLREQLCQVFLGQDNTVTLVLQCHPAETDINVLSGLILEQQND